MEEGAVVKIPFFTIEQFHLFVALILYPVNIQMNYIAFYYCNYL